MNVNLLNNSATLVTHAEITAAITGVNIERINDDPNNKVVSVNIVGYPGAFVLWQGSTYDAVGQWTDNDVKSRISGMAASGISPFKI